MAADSKNAGASAENLKQLQHRIGYEFTFEPLLQLALTHASYAHEHHCEHNETLEFLGDAIVDTVLSSVLFKRYYWWTEGDLTIARSSLVSAEHLAKKAEYLGVGAHVLLGRGEERTGGAQKESILAAVFEAIIAAVFMDGGAEAAEDVVMELFESDLANLDDAARTPQYCSLLRERMRSQGIGTPVYKTTRVTSTHDRELVEMELFIDDQRFAMAHGWSEEEAAERCARLALHRWMSVYPDDTER